MTALGSESIWGAMDDEVLDVTGVASAGRAVDGRDEAEEVGAVETAG